MNKKTIVTCYNSPDLDGFACAIAYSEYLSKKGQLVKAYIDGKPQVEANFIAEKLDIDTPNVLGNYDQIILVDASNLNGFPKNLDPNKVIEVIDHRNFGDLSPFPNAQKMQIDPVGAAATLISEGFLSNNINISKESAILLHQAIVSNTLNFQAKVTTTRDKDAAKWLQSQTDIPLNLTRKMFEAKSDMKEGKLLKNMQDTFAFPFDVLRKKLGISQLEVIDAERLIEDRKHDIIAILELFKKKFSLDLIFASIIDLEKRVNIFISTNSSEEKILNEIFNIKFNDNVASREGLIMRKEIIPLITEKYGRS